MTFNENEFNIQIEKMAASDRDDPSYYDYSPNPAYYDVHLATADEVAESLKTDPGLFPDELPSVEELLALKSIAFRCNPGGRLWVCSTPKKYQFYLDRAKS